MKDTVLLNADEVAALLRLPLTSVYELSRSGHLPVVRIGRLVRFDPAQLAVFISAGGTARQMEAKE